MTLITRRILPLTTITHTIGGAMPECPVLYCLGSVLILEATFEDTVTDEPIDPDTVSVEIRDPLGEVAVITAPTVTNPEPGVYRLNYEPLQPGRYYFRWLSTGDGAGAACGTFEVAFDFVNTPPYQA